MPTIPERLRTLNVKTQSPDMSVQVTLTRTHGIEVELEPGTTGIHNEGSLQQQLEAALTAALEGYGRAIELIEEEAYGPSALRDPDMPKPPRYEAFHRAADRLEVEAVSPKKYISIVWIGRGDFVVHIKRGALQRLDDGDLAREINITMELLTEKYSNEIQRLHKEVYQPVHYKPKEG